MTEPNVEPGGYAQAPAATPEATPDQTPDQTPEQTHEQIPEATSEAASAGVPESSESVRPALDRLADLDALPTHEHVEVYDDVHRRLHGALSDLDAARG